MDGTERNRAEQNNSSAERQVPHFLLSHMQRQMTTKRPESRRETIKRLGPGARGQGEEKRGKRG
jgi:hypothetical protein